MRAICYCLAYPGIHLSFLVCTQTSPPAACAARSSQQACRIGGVRNSARCSVYLASMVAQHAVQGALVYVVDARPAFEQGVVLVALPLFIHHSDRHLRFATGGG